MVFVSGSDSKNINIIDKNIAYRQANFNMIRKVFIECLIKKIKI